MVFLTSAHHAARTGPAVYSQYLWEHFQSSETFDFHLVTLGTEKEACRTPSQHIVQPGKSSVSTYRRLSTEALKVATGLGPNTIVHGNMTHLLSDFADRAFPLLAQVNDYDTATVRSRWRGYLVSRRPRRLISLMWRRRIECRVLQAADLGIYNSEATRALVRQCYGLVDDQHVVVYKAVDVDHFRPPPSLPADPVDIALPGPRLVFVGSNWRIKGLEYLIRALPTLTQLHRQLVLDIVGIERSSLSADLQRLITRERLEANINFAGRVTRADIASHYWHADLAILPSLRESLGVAILEAVAAELPVIASRVGGIPEILNHVATGATVTAGSTRELEEAIGQALANPPTAQSKQRAADRLRGLFDLQTMLETVEHLYSTMPAKRSGRQRSRASFTQSGRPRPL